MTQTYRALAEIHSDINQLQVNIANSGSSSDREGWEEDKKVLQEELRSTQAYLDSEKAHGDRVETTLNYALSALERITSNGLTLRNCCGSDDDYGTALDLVGMVTTSQAEQSSLIIQGYEEREIQLTRQLKLSNDNSAEMTASVGKLQAEVSVLTLDKADAIAKRNAAAMLLEEAQAEVERLNKEVAEKREQLELGVLGSMKVIDTEQQRAERDARDARVKAEKTIMPEVVPDRDINPLNFQITLAATGEKKWVKYYDLNGYIKLTDPNEVEQFRLKHAEKENIPNMDVVDEPDQITEVAKPAELFQTPDGDIRMVDNTPTPDGENQAPTVTLAKFEALQERVTRLEVILDERAVA